ncbi:MAG TPA: hypothetical protein PKE41_11790 [Candidatus Macondimonas sp.]|nr:hypothetical protein [Candidatus Macondimonas sp.]
MSDLAHLATENALLRRRVAQLEDEVAFLRTHPVFLQGLKGEALIATLTGGELTSFAAEHDIVVDGDVKIEVKFSKLNTPVAGSATRRWNWSKPLGWKDKGKDYDLLLLVGDKDLRYPEQYKDSSPYVFFLVPKAHVPSICSSGSAIGANVQLTTNLARAMSPASIALKSYMVSATEISAVFASARAA